MAKIIPTFLARHPPVSLRGTLRSASRLIGFATRVQAAAINFDHFHTVIALHATGLQLCLTTRLLYILLVECIHCFIMQSKRRRVEAPRIREKYFLRDYWGELNISTGAKPFDTIYTRVQQHTATKSTAGSRPRFYQDVTFLRENDRGKKN